MKMYKRLIATIIILTFFIESAGVEFLSSAGQAKGSALRPVATQASGQQSNESKASSAGSSNPGSGNPKRKKRPKLKLARRRSLQPKELRTPKKKEPTVRASGLLNAALFVGVVVGTFMLSSHFFNNPLVIFAVPAVSAAATLLLYGMLGDVIKSVPGHTKAIFKATAIMAVGAFWSLGFLAELIMLVPRLIKHRFSLRRVAREMESEKRRRVLAKAGRKAERILQKAQELVRAGAILKIIFEENPPSKFDDFLSYEKAITAEMSAKLSNRQRKIKAIKIALGRSRKEAREYFIRRKMWKEQDRQARELKEEKDRQAREFKEAVEDLAEKTRTLDSIEGRLRLLKEKHHARIAKLKAESIERLSLVDWTAFGNPEEYVKRLEEAIATEVKEDPEIDELFDILKIEGVKSINERNDRLLIGCKHKLSKLNPDMLIKKMPLTPEEFSRRLTEIKKEFVILPGINKLIEAKLKEWERYRGQEHRANSLDGALFFELDSTKNKADLHKLKSAREFGNLIRLLVPNQKIRWSRRYDSTLAQKYFDIAQEELQSIRTGEYGGQILKSKQVGVINYALQWLRGRLERYESAEIKDMRDKLSKQLYDVVKAAGEQTGGLAEAPPASSFTGKVPDAAEAVIAGTLEEALRRSRGRAADTIEAAEQMFEEDKGLNASCTLLVMLHSLDAAGKLFRELELKEVSKRRYDNLERIVIDHLIEVAKTYDKPGKLLTEEDEKLLKGFPRIVRYVYIIAKLPEASGKAAYIIWQERAIAKLAPIMAKAEDSERFQRLYDKLTKDLGMFTGNPSGPLDDLKGDIGKKSSSAGAVSAVDVLVEPGRKRTEPVSSGLRYDISSAISSAA